MSQTVWPLNENGEIVFSAGTGSSNVTGYLSQDVLPSAEGGIPLVVSGLFNYGNAIFSKCKSGSSQSQLSRFTDEILSAAESGATLILPAGTINLSGVSSPISVAGVRLLCLSGLSILDAMTANYGSLFDVTGGDVDCESVAFRLWNKPISSSQTLGTFRFSRCGLIENRGHITLLDRSDYPNSYADSVVIDRCFGIDSPGFEVKGAIGEAVVTHNRFLRVRRKPGVWDHTQNHRLYAICIGDHDDVPPEIAQMATRKVLMQGNIVRGVDNQSVSGITTNGLVATAQELIISHNIVDDVNSPGNPYDCEGIYLKGSFGNIHDNILTDATRESCSIAIKGKSYGSPIADKLKVFNNTTRAKNATNSIGITVFGSATDVEVTENSVYDMKDGGIVVLGSPVRNHVRRNKLVRCGGIPVYFACGEITDCDVSGNEVIDQVISTPDEQSRPNNPYPDTGTFNASGIYMKAIVGQVKSFTVTNGGSGYAVNGSPTGSCFVQVSGGYGGSGTGAYAYFEDGKLVSVVTASTGSGWTTAPTVLPLTSAEAGVTITHSGESASVTAELSSGAIVNSTLKDNRFRGTYQYDAAKNARNYECISLSNTNSAVSKNTEIDGVHAVIDGEYDGANPFYICGVTFYNAGFGPGRVENINMLGNTAGRRQQPWRANNSSRIATFTTISPQMYLGPARVAAGLVHPQTTLFVSSGKARATISFSRFTSGNNYLGSLLGGESEGKVRITKVVPRYVLQSGGSALTAASGSPTVGIGTGSGLTNLVAATALGSIGSVTSPVDGQVANEVSPSGSDAEIYLTISGGSIASNSRAYLVVDIDYTVLI